MKLLFFNAFQGITDEMINESVANAILHTNRPERNEKWVALDPGAKWSCKIFHYTNIC